MKNYKNLLFYVLTIVGFSALIYFTLKQGLNLESNVTKAAHQNDTGSWKEFGESILQSFTHPLARLLMQIITIIIVARVFGFLCKKINQPAVIGEIIAGIALGPSLLGMYFPDCSAFLFPAASMGNLQFLSQVGLILFMFIVGMELDLKVLKNQAKDAVVISHASIIFPFALGIGLAYFVYNNFAPQNIAFLPFALFMGIAMSITAFPVLARIVQERNLSKTKLGSIVITCAAADDITAWCILAAVIAIVKAGSIVSAIYTIMMAAAYVLLMLKVVQPFFKRLGEKYADKESLSKPVVAIFFMTLLLSAWATEVIGIHALFGAFLAGVIMPANIRFRNIFIEKIEDVSLVLLLPLFFVFTGLRTQIGLLDDPYLWKVCLAIIAVAVTGKFIGSALAARFVGQSWRESLAIGALMNTRGLMELVVLNIGYDLGVLSPQIFAMMVIMALVTTFMTGPALDLINRFLPEKPEKRLSGNVVEGAKYNILVSFSSAQKGISLLRLANKFILKSFPHSNITMLHLSPGNELNQYNEEEYERESFAPIEEEAKKIKQPITTMFKPTLQVDSEITQMANLGNYDLLLIGFGSSVFEGSLLGKILGFTTKIINPERLYDTITGKEGLFESSIFDERVKNVLKSTKIPVGVYIDNGIAQIETVFVPVFSVADSALLVYAQKLIYNSKVKVIVFDVESVIKHNPEIKETINAIERVAPGHIALYNDREIDKPFLHHQNLMLISMESWKKVVEAKEDWLSDIPSVLILKP